MTQAASTASSQIQSLIEVTESLNAIFGQENQLLKEQRPLEITPLQAEKARLAAIYAQSIKDIAADRSRMNSADHALLTKLREITKSFEERAAAQRALLDGARKAAEGIVKAVAEEAAADDRSSYGDAHRPNTNVAPISIDESA